MDFAPEKFFAGLFDFFSILLPGALLSYLLKGTTEKFLIGKTYSEPAGTEGWAVFLAASYLVGHFVYLLSAWLLDDYFYDPVRKATYSRQVQRLAKGERLSPWLARVLAGILFKENSDRALRQAEHLKDYGLGCSEAYSAINTFQWCKARLALEHPEAMATVQRFEADSKFFRSFVVVLCILIAWGFGAQRMNVSYVAAISVLPALWRYTEQRSKATNQAYWFIITLEGSNNCGLPVKATENSKGFSHAGGVVVRHSKNVVEYLLVQAKKNPQEWVLPKGHIEPGESIRETAVREVREETGVWARVEVPLNDVSFAMQDGEQVRARFYLMEAEAEQYPPEKGREHAWLQLEDALRRASHENIRDALHAAAERYSSVPPVC